MQLEEVQQWGGGADPARACFEVRCFQRFRELDRYRENLIQFNDLRCQFHLRLFQACALAVNGISEAPQMSNAAHVQWPLVIAERCPAPVHSLKLRDTLLWPRLQVTLDRAENSERSFSCAYEFQILKKLRCSLRLCVHAKAQSDLLYAAFELNAKANIPTTSVSCRRYTTQKSARLARPGSENCTDSSFEQATPLRLERQWSIRTSRNLLEAARKAVFRQSSRGSEFFAVQPDRYTNIVRRLDAHGLQPLLSNITDSEAFPAAILVNGWSFLSAPRSLEKRPRMADSSHSAESHPAPRSQYSQAPMTTRRNRSHHRCTPS